MVTELKLTTNQITSPSHILVRWIFLRGLGIVYFIAFSSFFVQALGLIGANGILPAQLFLKEAGASLGSMPFLSCPTLFWIDCSDLTLRLLPACGVVVSLLLVAGICTGPCLILLWLMYLSIVTVGGDFMSFQWDVLLLEVGFLANFFSHYQLLDLPKKTTDASRFPAPSNLVLWLLRFLLFKLMLSSGCVKLLSGDPTWQNLSALHYHYWTQPLPTPLGWLAAQLPDWIQSFCVAVMFLIELIVPFFIFVPGRARLFAALLTIFLQVTILLTGNYTFFNLLTILLCFLLFDDSLILKLKHRRFAGALIESSKAQPYSIFTRMKLTLLVSIIVIMTLGRNVPFALTPIKDFAYALSPWCLVNSYGLFAVMTTSRKEIVIEASQDGVLWQPYKFYFKPGDVNRAPPWVAPYQPRLDWQMWFAALGTRSYSPWFAHFVLRLFQQSKDVRALLQEEPFNGQKPMFIRASLYSYEFTDLNELTKSGAWWKREYVGLFFPEASLETGSDTNEPEATGGKVYDSVD